jgi:ribose/xylose/arabinose/galactoside ABC-type transport system permease subunit
MTETGTTIVMVMVVIMMDGVIEGVVVDGGRVPMSTFTLGRLTPPTDTMRILLNMGITDTLHTGTTVDTRTKDYAMARIPRGLSGWKVTL